MSADYIPLSFTTGRNSRWILVLPPARVGITINAAFLREIKEDNQRLREMVNTITLFAIAGVYSSRDGALVARHVRELRAQIRFQFDLEETYGYIESAIAAAAKPEIAQRAAQVRAEHVGIRDELDSLYDVARRVATEPAGHRSRFDFVVQLRSLLHRFDRHERRERELIDRLSALVPIV